MAQMYYYPPRTFFAVKGVPLPSPKECKWTYQDFDSDLSTRATDGTMVRDRITTKRKFEFSFNPLTEEDTKLILSVLNTSLEYVAISYDRVMMPASYDEYSNLSLTQQQDLLNRIKTYTGVNIDPVKFYEDNEYRQDCLDRVDDGLAEHNAEMNDKVFFTLTIKDPATAKYENLTVYVGDRTGGVLFAYPDPNGTERDMAGNKCRYYYKDMAFSLIEK